MRRVNVDRMRRHQRRGRDTLRVYLDGQPVTFTAEWDRGGSVVVTPAAPGGVPVVMPVESWNELMRHNGKVYPPLDLSPVSVARIHVS